MIAVIEAPAPAYTEATEAPPGYAEGEIIHHDLILAQVDCPLCGEDTELGHDYYDDASYHIDLCCNDGHRWRWEPYVRDESLFRCVADPFTWEE